MGKREDSVAFRGAVITPNQVTPLPEVQENVQQRSLTQIVGSLSREQEDQTALASRAVEQAESPARGDDLIEASKQFENLDAEESAFLKLFSQSKDLVEARAKQDQAFKQVFFEEAKKLKGNDLANYIIDKADEVKIDYLKTNDPKFTSQQAALVGLGDDLTFGQLSRLSGAAESLVGDESLQASIEEKAEEYRLLQKAFPTADIAGRLGSFFIPGSPIAKVFNMGRKAAAVGKAGKAAKLFGKVIKNPNLLTRAGVNATGVGLGAAAIGGARGTLGSGLEQPLDIERGLEDAGAAGFIGGLLGAGGTVAHSVGQQISRAAAPSVKATVKSVDRFWGRIFEKTTGVREETLRQAAKERATGARGPSTMRGQAGREADIGDDLVDFLQSQRSKLPEVQQADKILPNLPTINLKMVSNNLRRASKEATPKQRAEAKSLQQWADWMEKQVKNPSAAEPDQVRIKILDKIQDELRTEFGKNSAFFSANLKNAGRLTRKLIEQRAVEVGRKGGEGSEAAKTYVGLMRKAAEKRGILNFISKRLGNTDEKMRETSERYIRNLFGRNTSLRQSKMRALDEKFGTDFAERARLADLAKSTGDASGTLGVIPNINTGAFARGALGGLALGAGGGLASGDTGIGGAVGFTAGALLSSPALASRLLGTSSKVSDFSRLLFANPEALQRIGRSGPVDGTVRQIAKTLQRAYEKDGPVTASGYLRLVADTPYFLGLVNAFNEIEESRAEPTQQRALESLKSNQRQERP